MYKNRILLTLSAMLLLASCGSSNPPASSNSSSPAVSSASSASSQVPSSVPSSSSSQETPVSSSKEETSSQEASSPIESEPSSEASSESSLEPTSSEKTSEASEESTELSSEETSSEQPIESTEETSSEQPIESSTESSEITSESSVESVESSEETTSSEELPTFTIRTSVSGFGVSFVGGDIHQAKAEDEISFTLTRLADYYELSAVYFTVTGSSSRMAIAEKEGVYTFTMPYMDVTIHVESIRSYALSESAEHATITYVETKKAYYKNGEKISFTVTPDDGYKIDEVTYSTESASYSTKLEDNVYSFVMPDSDATICVSTSELIEENKDPWANNPKTYYGEINRYSNNDYVSYFELAFKGDGTFDFTCTRDEWEEDWGDYYEAHDEFSPASPITKKDWYSSKYGEDKGVAYQYDETQECFIAQVKDHGSNKHELKFKANLTGDQPTSITFLTNIGSDSAFQCQGKTIGLKK